MVKIVINKINFKKYKNGKNEKLVTIDLDKNLIIPIKESFDKKQLIYLVADYYEYDKGETKGERKTFEGTFKQFQQFAEGKDNIQIIQVNDDSVLYQETSTIPYEISKMEFGIHKFINPAMDVLIEILTKAQTKQEEEKIKQEQEILQEKLQAYKKDIGDNLKKLKDIDLSNN